MIIRIRLFDFPLAYIRHSSNYGESNILKTFPLYGPFRFPSFPAKLKSQELAECGNTPSDIFL